MFRLLVASARDLTEYRYALCLFYQYRRKLRNAAGQVDRRPDTTDEAV